jgi:hypothetical protein
VVAKKELSKPDTRAVANYRNITAYYYESANIMIPTYPNTNWPYLELTEPIMPGVSTSHECCFKLLDNSTSKR